MYYIYIYIYTLPVDHTHADLILNSSSSFIGTSHCVAGHVSWLLVTGWANWANSLLGSPLLLHVLAIFEI